MKLKEFLKTKTNTWDKIAFFQDGWFSGATVIDSEDLFLKSLDVTFLDKEVISSEYKEMKFGNDSCHNCPTIWLSVNLR